LALLQAEKFRTLRGHFSSLQLLNGLDLVSPKPTTEIRKLIRLQCAVFQLAILLVVGGMIPGCRSFNATGQPPNLGGRPAVENPLRVPMLDRWFVMDQISDEIDDYFRIKREERIRVLDGVMSEGSIETHPEIGGTVLEPWKKDSTRGFERVQATLQTIRRFAKVRVIPTGNSYLVDVKVYKELEDLNQPVGATVSAPQFRYDNALDAGGTNPWQTNIYEGWIPLGRDFSLEQKIMRNIQARLAPQSEYDPGIGAHQ
jgi:hypothetical protein